MQRQELSGLDGGPIVVESELTDEKASAVLRGLVACGLISPAAGHRAHGKARRAGRMSETAERRPHLLENGIGRTCSQPRTASAGPSARTRCAVSVPRQCASIWPSGPEAEADRIAPLEIQRSQMDAALASACQKITDALRTMAEREAAGRAATNGSSTES